MVANKVESLANETARATAEIGRKIDTIQTDTRGAVAPLQDIGAIIRRIADIQATVAGAGEEQMATTNEMSRNVAEAARAATDIARSVQGVAQTAVGTREGASRSQTAAVGLADTAESLRALVARFHIGDAAGAVTIPS